MPWDAVAVKEEDSRDELNVREYQVVMWGKARGQRRKRATSAMGKRRPT